MSSSSSSPSWSSSFPAGDPHHCSTVSVLYELLKGEEEPCRVWLRDEMIQIPDPLVDSIFHGLICSSSSSAVPQSRSTVAELCKQLEGEKEQVRKVLQGEMNRLTNTLFGRLTNKLRNSALDRSEDSGDRAQVVHTLDQAESHNPQSHQPVCLIAQPSTNGQTEDCVKQEIKEEFEDGEMMDIKKEVEDEDETRIIDMTGDSEGGNYESRSGGNARTDTTRQMDCNEAVFKGEFDYGQEIVIKQEEEDESTNNEVKLEIKEEEEEEEEEVNETQVNDIDEVAESNQSDDDESRSVENAPMDTTSPHPSGQSQVNIIQSRRSEKRKQTDKEPQQQAQAPNEVNIEGDTEDDQVDDEVTSRSVKRARPSRPATLSSAKEKKIITVRLRCPQVGCGEIAKHEFNQHLMEQHSIGSFQCVVKDCAQWFTEMPLLRQHIGQSHQHTAQWHCPKCPKHFISYRQLSIHNIDYHQLGHFQCSFASCMFTGEYKRKVYDHYTMQHKEKPELVCPVAGCVYRTKYSTRLKTHEHSHLGIKPYHCKWPDCHYSSASQGYTLKHIKATHFKSRSKTSSSLDLTHLGKPKDYIELVP